MGFYLQSPSFCFNCLLVVGNHLCLCQTWLAGHNLFKVLHSLLLGVNDEVLRHNILCLCD